MMTEDMRIGNRVRMEIKKRFLTNMFVIQQMREAGFKMTEATFSNKLGGSRAKFTPDEIKKINSILDTSIEV